MVADIASAKQNDGLWVSLRGAEAASEAWREAGRSNPIDIQVDCFPLDKLGVAMTAHDKIGHFVLRPLYHMLFY